MADKGSLIVIKKVYVNAAGAHGGSWKVAFADFMTAMMCFFLVMWLLSSNASDRANVAEYFSTPSVIEYEFQHYGVELTLEKLFLDLFSEPLKVFQSFITPIDHTPNIMSFGLKKVVLQHLANELGEVAEKVSVTSDTIDFDIPESVLFEKGTANPSAQYAVVMDKVKKITVGLEDSTIEVTSQLYYQNVPNKNPKTTKNVAEARVDIVGKEIETSFESKSMELKRKVVTGSADKLGPDGMPMGGKIKISIKQKQELPSGKIPRKLENVFGESSSSDQDVYQQFVDRLSKRKIKK
ncbi:MAG: flagellar motor protein MotB [Pseudomonadota bacterium]|nr:flagellar motor protein MotB [Pseudomonadota bacterium]